MKISDELKAKLLTAKSEDEVAELVKADGQESTTEEIALIWDEIIKLKAQDGKELSTDELEAITGGHSLLEVNDWSKLGCAATVEEGSSCASNDACQLFYYTYDNFTERCPADPRMPHQLEGDIIVNWKNTPNTRRRQCTRCSKWIEI